MNKTGLIFALLGAVAILIAGLATYLILNFSVIGLMESGVIIGVAVAGLIIVLAVLAFVVKTILARK